MIPGTYLTFGTMTEILLDIISEIGKFYCHNFVLKTCAVLQ